MRSGGVEVGQAEGSLHELGSGSRGQRVILFTLGHTCFELVGFAEHTLVMFVMCLSHIERNRER